MMIKLFRQDATLFSCPDNAGLYAFLQACAAGDTSAQQQFQETYGEDIYHFPVKIYGTPIDEAGDYYVYVFERDRIFSRLRTFEGRNDIQFRTFLSHYVLKHLFVEWRRTCKDIETVSLQTPMSHSDDDSLTLEDVLSSSDGDGRTCSEDAQANRPPLFWSRLGPEEQLYLKLLSLLEGHLRSEDVCLLANISGRTVEDTRVLLSEIQDHLQWKDKKVAHLCDELDSVWGWIVLRQKELRKIQQKIASLSAMENGLDTQPLVARKRAVENALAKRIRQRERLVDELRTYKLTTSYKDIARLLNTTTARVYSRIFALREQLVRERSERWPREEMRKCA